MKKGFQKIIALILCLSMLSCFGAVTVFAEDTTPETTETTAEPEDTSAIKAPSVIETIIQFFHDFIGFLHDQYLKFAVVEGDEDIFGWYFTDSGLSKFLDNLFGGDYDGSLINGSQEG